LSTLPIRFWRRRASWGFLLPTSPLPSPAGQASGPSGPWFSPSVANVDFHGGLIGGTRTRPGVVSNTPLFVGLGPEGSFPQTYASGTLQFLQELARSSGSPSNPLAPITTLYADGGRRLADSVSFGSPQHFHLRSPAGSRAWQPDATRNVYPDGTGFGLCVTSTYLVSNVVGQLTRTDSSSGVDRIYSVFLPPGVEVCDGSKDVAQGGSCN